MENGADENTDDEGDAEGAAVMDGQDRSIGLLPLLPVAALPREDDPVVPAIAPLEPCGARAEPVVLALSPSADDQARAFIISSISAPSFTRICSIVGISHG